MSEETLEAAKKIKEVADEAAAKTTARVQEWMAANKPKSRMGAYVMFPRNLHDLLENADYFGFEHTISWMPDGTSFRIHEPWNMDQIIKQFFNQNKWKSFLRQLQNYGFERVLRGRERGVCRHPLFVRGRRDLSEGMKRTVHLKSSPSTSSTSSTASQETPPSSTAPTIVMRARDMNASNPLPQAAPKNQANLPLQQADPTNQHSWKNDAQQSELQLDPFEHDLSFLAYLCELQTPMRALPRPNLVGFPGPASVWKR
jgi:hypothetical protein